MPSNEQSAAAEAARMPADELFLRVYEDLRVRVASNDDYDLLNLGRLLRQLLLDGSHGLLVQANRKYRLSYLRFLERGYESGHEGPKPKIPPEIEPYVREAWKNALPGTFPKPIKLDAYLKSVAGVINHEGYTVKEIILYAAQYAGAVHRESKPRDEYKSLDAFNASWFVGNTRVVFGMLRGIANETLWALLPLVHEIQRMRKDKASGA